MKKLFIIKTYFSLFVICHIVFYVIVLFLSDIRNALVTFSGVWTVEYLFVIRRFLTNPIDDFAAKHISYAKPNIYWVNFAKGLIKNSNRFMVASLAHVIMALSAILIFKSIINRPLIIVAILISNAVLPITYLFVLRRLYSFWRENIDKRIEIEN